MFKYIYIYNGVILWAITCSHSRKSEECHPSPEYETICSQPRRYKGNTIIIAPYHCLLEQPTDEHHWSMGIKNRWSQKVSQNLYRHQFFKRIQLYHTSSYYLNKIIKWPLNIYKWLYLVGGSRKITNTSYLHPHLFLTCQQCSLLVGNPPLNQIYFILFLSLPANIRWNNKEKLDTAFASRLGWNKMGPFHF